MWDNLNCSTVFCEINRVREDDEVNWETMCGSKWIDCMGQHVERVLRVEEIGVTYKSIVTV